VKQIATGKEAGNPTQLCGNCVEAARGRLPISAAIFLNLGKRASYKFSASDESRNRLPVGKLALWRAIQWYKSRGLETLDLGRSSIDNSGLRRYKQAWGSTERRIKNLKYDLATGKFVVQKDKVFGWYNRFFGRCPPRLSRWIGSLLYPHLD
jgi:lipid II:glycine glycyltransferase (peptidoglycan interpeptide bridge formation enzyme)